MIEFLNVDCIELMKLYPNNHFDLAIVDPPFGIGENWRKDPEYYSLATERIAKHQKLINEKNKQGKISFS